MIRRETRVKIDTCLYAMVGIAVFLLIMRSMGLAPTVFADEYTYSKLSRLTSFSEANIPAYVYLLIFRVTNFCADGFLSCARVVNIVFFVSAAPFIFLVGKELTDEKTALLVAAASIAGPINTYTAYFMPEALYFFSFWLFTYLMLSVRHESLKSYSIFLGIIFGILALIKPHALFLIPALGIYFVAAQRKLSETNGSRAASFAIFVGAAILTKLAIGFALGGISGLTLFGPAYTSVATESIGGVSHYINLVSLAFLNLQGHLLSLSLLFSVPIAQMILISRIFLKPEREMRASNNVALYTILIFAVLIIVVVFFTASVSGAGPYESNARLHMRYYNFAFPLLLLVGASQLAASTGGVSFRSRMVIGLPIAAAICYSAFTQLSPYSPSLVDSPEIRGFTGDVRAFYVLSGLSALSLALWVYAAHIGARFFFYLFLPLSVAWSTFYVHQELRQRLVLDVFDKAGIFAKQYLTKADIAKVLIVGSDPSGLYRSLFYLDDAKASLETIPTGASYDVSKLPIGKEWVLVVGTHALTGSTMHQLSMNGFALARRTASNIISFTDNAWPGVMTAQGLSSAEPWGAWSESDVVTFDFSMPLPEKFSVDLIAHAFGPNAGKEIVAHVGDSTAKFTLGTSDSAKVLEFVNSSRSNRLRFTIPSPVSPKELGMGGDERTLGIGFIEMKITSQRQ